MPKVDKKQITLPQVYKHYKTTTDNPVDYKIHKQILDAWGELVNEFLLQGKDVKLHNGMSTLGIRKKIKRTFIDKKASREAGKEIRSSNVHSGFYGANVFWRRHYTTFNSSGWGFFPSRALHRGLAKVMKTAGGHLRFMQRAMVTSKNEQAKSIYNKKVIGV